MFRNSYLKERSMSALTDTENQMCASVNMQWGAKIPMRDETHGVRCGVKL